MATFYGIASLHEARAYLGYLYWGRGSTSARTVLELEAGSLHEIFGSPDDMKFQSSMSLFSLAAAEPASVFYRVLDRWCGGTLRSVDSKASAGGWSAVMCDDIGEPGIARGHLADRPRDCNPSAGRRNRVGPVALGLCAGNAEERKEPPAAAGPGQGEINPSTSGEDREQRRSMSRTRPYNAEQVRRIGETTIGYYDRFARAFWDGTRHHDVSQNYGAFLNAIES